MVRPLYPPRRKTGHEEPPAAPWWKSPQILLAGVCVLVVGGVTVYHFGGFAGIPGLPSSNTISDTTPSGSRGGYFSFLKGSNLWKKTSTSIDMHEDELADLGLSTDTARTFAAAGKVDNYRDQRRRFAIEKYEGSRRLAEEHMKEREEFQRQRSSPVALELKDAIEALDASDNLGVLKLEGLLQEQLLKTGGKRENLDILVYAFQSLGDVYARKNMQKKAKESYLAAFQLMKEQAPAEQGPEWDRVISEVQRLEAKEAGN
ncbi:MAG TPA: hypothetical protein VIV61_18545 [Candidatus Ozemobacteraceae bacterium]